MKTYTGIELLQAKMKDEIKQGQKVVDDSGNIYIATVTVNYFVDKFNEPIVNCYNSLDELLLSEFRLVEEPEEIDIQAIEELSEEKCPKISRNQTFYIYENRNKIKELLQAIKQLDNKLNNR